MATRIQLRRDTEANWTSANPTLSAGELAYSTDVNKIKIGNGSSGWNSLSYITDNTDEITEGVSNLFYTDERVDDRVAQLLTAGSNITLSYDDGAGTLTISATEDNLSNNTTNDLAEGNTNLYFTVERAQDAVGEMVTGNTESGISVTYDDETNKLNFDVSDPTLTFTGDATGSGTITNLGSTSIELTVADNSHNHTASNISDFTEAAQDVIGGMVDSNTESGISVSYDDETGKLNFNVNDPTITLSGDVTGSATMTDLGNVTITTTVAADSVALGTDTTGDYVATIAGTTDQISVAGEGTESRAVTLSLPQSIATTSSPTFAGATLDSVRVGVTNVNEIDTSSGNLILDSAGGTVEIDDNLTVAGDLTVNGTTTTINATTISVDDKNIELGSVDTPTDTTANGGGITLKGTTDKTFNWSDTTDSWTSSEHIDLASGKVIKINGTQVLSATEYAGNAATVTNGVVTTGSYSDPTWISSLAWSKISTTPTTLSGYGITDAQALDADLTAIAGLTGTSGFLKKTAENTWSLDTSTYLTGNETVTLSGDVTGSGATAITVTLANTGVAADTYGSATAIPVITVDAKGRITGVTTSSVEGLPSQTGNAGKYLTTNGTAASWGTIEEGLNPLLLGGM